MSKTLKKPVALQELALRGRMLHQRDVDGSINGVCGLAVTQVADDKSVISVHPCKKTSGGTWATSWTQRWQKLKHPAMTRPYDPNDSDML
jgi:hypothetical protein